jgi:hypothetical protein
VCHYDDIVGNSLSLADVLIYNALAEELRAEEVEEDFPQWKREPFADKARVQSMLEKYPRLHASIEAVSSNQNIQKWLSIRGKQGF